MPYLTKDSEIPTKGKGRIISHKMRLFVDEYLVDLNASAAVLRAGYKTRNPNRLGTELLNHPLVIKKIEELQDEKREKLNLSAEYVLNKLISIVENTDKSNPQAALRGLELLGKHLGLYRDRTEISGPDGEAIKTEQKIQKDVDEFTSRLSRLAATGGASEVTRLPHPRGDSEA